MSRKFSGAGVALVTPFDQEMKPDYTAYEKLLTHVSRENGVDYLVVQGTTGESVTTTAAEQASLLRFTIEHNPRKLPVVYGLGGNNTEAVLDTLRQADLEGVDAILSVSPAYNKPHQEGIVRHYTTIADASPVPVILYNVPGRTASNVRAETTLRLAEHPNIIATKEASGSLEQAMEISRHKPKDFYLLSGDDMLTVPMMSVGAEGVISVLANGFPDLIHDMVHAALKGDFKKASEVAFRLIDMNSLIYEESNPVGIKAVLAAKGVCDARVRMPLLPVSEDLNKRILQVLDKM
ncbi:4-hydroxy-tetrahydrodipicolinate synthase [Roseivirga sp. BDSF3-8]|uniref:4-hydroxy-tetrahydrodipicolinate synthase n=1 Tax=Roseivirga sp. BDSF3-8 TaxID=3241598 RepID=UPI00353254EB